MARQQKVSPLSFETSPPCQALSSLTEERCCPVLFLGRLQLGVVLLGCHQHFQSLCCVGEVGAPRQHWGRGSSLPQESALLFCT